MEVAKARSGTAATMGARPHFMNNNCRRDSVRPVGKRLPVNLLSAFLLAMLPFNAFSQNAAMATLFGWMMEPRFGADADGDGAVDYECVDMDGDGFVYNERRCREYVFPSSWRVTFDACSVQPTDGSII